ncbi:ribosomal protein S6 kinase delta-1 isoform X1 [Nasonia vitripennis]|uniref:Ribosomal protein S6 kinase delta-1 n=1 Tax=Nasonia vitripennis TaxID=7425 RepID=A0A7M7G206_NASVI|nr:ribosomal protein S6 kinase delta-1 isoform X1 [Nasonia vitripennis]
MAPPKDKWVRRFVISETSRHKKGFTVYKVTSMMFLKTSPDVVSKVSIWKRYSDFKKLYSTMQSLHSTMQIKEPFPPFPKPKFFGRFEAEVIEERRECALKLLEFIGRHNALFTSDAFVKFFETDNLDKRFLDCSQSLSSDTSDDDRNVNCENEENGITNTTNLPKFVCTKKVKPIKVGNQKDVKAKQASCKGSSSKSVVVTSSYEHYHVNCNNNNTKDSATDIVDGLEAITCEENGSKYTDAINKSVVIHDGSDLTQSFKESAQYILIAAAHMSAAFRHEAIAEYEEAFTQYKLGIAHLINGIQNEIDQEKKVVIQEKITKYLQRAERLYNRHLNCNVSVLHKPVTELRNYKVIELTGSVMLAKDVLQGFIRVIKTVEKVAGCKKDISAYILRGRVPYMVQLYSCMQTDSTVFLILQYMSRGKLWSFAKNNYKPDAEKLKHLKRGHSRSFSCDAVIQLDLVGKSHVQENIPKVDITGKETNSFISSKNYLITPINELALGDTTELVKNAQKLLQSVSATLKRSNSIASRLNESERLLYKPNSNKEGENSVIDWENRLKSDSLCIEDNEDTEASGDLSELSISESCTELNNDKGVDLNVKIDNRESKEDLKKAENENSAKLSNLKLVNKLYTENSSNGAESFKFSEDQIQYKVENYPVEVEKKMWVIPESIVKIWAAEILLALEALHQQDVIISDLRPDNILIDDCGNVCMTYIVPRNDTELLRLKKPYSSPELCMFTPPISITTSADVWSFGVLLYELLTGFDFQTKHPGQFHTHSLINIPESLSKDAKTLLQNILKYQPSDRLTIPEIKQHPFFANTDWLELLNA